MIGESLATLIATRLSVYRVDVEAIAPLTASLKSRGDVNCLTKHDCAPLSNAILCRLGATRRVRTTTAIVGRQRFGINSSSSSKPEDPDRSRSRTTQSIF